MADAAAEIVVGPGYEGCLRSERIIGGRLRAHIVDLGDLTFRLLCPDSSLTRGMKFRGVC